MNCSKLVIYKLLCL